MKIEVSTGEILDKWTILKIKMQRIKDKDKLANVGAEYVYLNDVKDDIEHDLTNTEYQKLSVLVEQLYVINTTLWDIEDAIRDKELAEEFDQEFIEIARSVYITNDKRAAVKKQINTLTRSDFTEEKSYKEYQ